MNSNKNTFLVYGIGIFVAYAYGIITAQYKIFPYKEIREIKRFINSDTSAKNHRKTLNQSPTYLNKKSFFEEHGHNAEVVMLGDSFIDNAEWEALFPSKLIVDQGIGGDTTDGVLDRLNLSYEINASKIFIMIGINDLINGKDTDEVINNYEIILNELVENNIKIYIQSTLLLGPHNKEINSKVILLNSFLEEYAVTNELITYIDLNASLSNRTFLIDEYTNDGKTLNGKGYKIWRDIISPYIM